MNIMIFTDNKFMYENFINIIKIKKLHTMHKFTFACSPNNTIFDNNHNVHKIQIKNNVDDLITKYALIISCHSKQIFPDKLVNSIRCINIHPGLNPYNRGWFPQVFSILNKKPLGATIHEMDEQIDHGSIIIQKEIDLYSWDTSLTAYNRVIETEVELLNESIEMLINGTYQTTLMVDQGNYNTKKDYDALCKIDLNNMMTVKDTIDYLRALTHGDFNNAYFIDEDNNKVYIKISLQKEELNES